MRFEIASVKQKNKYLYFAIKLAGFFVVLFVLDFVIGSTLEYFYFKQQSGADYRATYVMEEAKEELLIMGSSRALHHYQAEIMERKLGLTTYNAGRNGNPILYHLALLKSVLKRHKPKQIILDININEFKEMKDSYDILSMLLPYYKTHPEVRPIIHHKSEFERLKLLSKIYPYNSLMFTIAVGNLDFNKKRRDVFKGYMPLVNTWYKKIEVEKKQENYVIDSVKVNALKTFIADCKRNNIELILVFSPYYKIFEETNNSIVLAKQIAKQNNIRFIDFTNDKRFNSNISYFADYTHLNDEGAIYFTDIFIDSLSKSHSKKALY